MKVDQQVYYNQIEQQHQLPYFMWEQHNVTLIRNPNYGYGIAISGGLCANNQDASIYVSDIVPGGPAENKLMVDDKLLSVNGVNVENVEHSFVIRLLKEAKEFIHLVIKRKIKSISPNCVNETELINESKRHNLAIQQTAATVMANFNSKENSNQQQQSQNLMSQMMNGTTAMSSLKPFKVTLNKKEKKDTFGIVIGCKYYIKEIVPNSLAANEANLRKGDIILKINDLTSDQFSLCTARKILLNQKSRENKVHLVVKRNSIGSSLSSCVSDDDSDLVIDETPIKVSMPVNTTSIQHPTMPPPPPPPPQSSSSMSNNQHTKTLSKSPTPNRSSISMAPEIPPRPNYLNCNGVTNSSTPKKEIVQNENAPSLIKQLFKPVKPINQIDLCASDNNRLSKFYSNKNVVLNYRTAIFARENGIGIRLAGGNKVGIFICDVQYNSPAERAGIKIADKIIKVNGVDYSTLTREEAVQNILNITTLIEMVVAHSPEEYEAFAFDPLGGDSFYVRTHFNYTSKNPNDLSFKINDILHVTDTLYNGVIGQWVVSKLLDVNQQQQNTDDLRGTVPNQANAEKLVGNAQTIDQYCSNGGNIHASNGALSNIGNGNTSNTNSNSNSMTLGASARMSLRKKLGGRNALNKRSKSATNAESDVEINEKCKVIKANTFHSNKYPAYERVVLKEANFIRPVVIFGSLADVAREKLKSESPTRYQIPDSYSTDPNDPQSQTSSGVIKLASIKEIIEKGQHCLLDITPNAVDHLNYAQYFPICIYLKSNSRNHTKELRQKYAKNLKAKSSRRLYDNALKLQTFYSHLFTHTITLDSNQWFKKLKEAIESQQTHPLWISQDLEHLICTTNDDIAKADTETVSSPHSIQNTNYVVNSTPNGNYTNYQQQDIQHQKNKAAYLSNRYLFDDNFEFPIYTAANPAMSVLSNNNGGASTYSLYEENNYRSSFAASDSDIAAVGHQNKSNDLLNGATNNCDNNYTNENLIYSTNFNNKPSTTTSYTLNTAIPIVISGDDQRKNDILNGSSASSSSILSSASNSKQHHINRVLSDSNMIVQQNYMNNHQARLGDDNLNYSHGTSNYLSMNIMNINNENSFTPNGYNNNSTYGNSNINQIMSSQHLTQENSFEPWKKNLPTYASNENSNYSNCIQSDTSNVPIVSSSSSCGIYYCPKPIQSSLASVTSPQKSIYQPHQHIHQHQSESIDQQFSRRLSGATSSINDYITNTEINSIQQTQANTLRNSASYSSYKLIKNSQSSLMPNTNKSIIDHPLLLAPVSSVNKSEANIKTNLLQTASNELNNNMQQIQSKMNNLKLSQQQLQFKKELDSKLMNSNENSNEKDNLNQNVNLKSIKNSMNFSNFSMINSTSNNLIKNNNNINKINPQPAVLSVNNKATGSSSHPNPPSKPPPTLPKPKFILPQTSATNLVLQRNLKSKSELNIATAPCSSCSSTDTVSAASSSSSSCCQQQQQQDQQRNNNSHQSVAPSLRNKILENSSLISSSQGYHSDTWESHSSRQSFDLDSQPATSSSSFGNNPTNANRFKHFNKISSKLAAESKIAKTTNLINQQQQHESSSSSASTSSCASSSSSSANAIGSSSCSDGSINGGIASGSDDTDSSSMPASNQKNNFKNHHQHQNSSSNINKQMLINSSTPQNGIITDGGIELPIYYQTTSNSNLNSNEDNLNNYSTMVNNSNGSLGGGPNKIINNNNSYSDLYSNETVKYRTASSSNLTTTYAAHYNDNGIYRKLQLDSNSNCSIIASANGIFDSNGGILESADTGVSLNVPEGAIAKGCSFDLYFKVCHCKSTITNGKGENLTNPIVMCGPRGIKFLKPIELQIPHFISIDGQSWSYAFKANESLVDESNNWNATRFQKKTLLNSVTVLIDSF